MKINYNKTIYGEPKYTPQETVARLQVENCFLNGVLRIYPDWFNASEMFEAINAGLLVSKNYHGYLNHTELRLPRCPRHDDVFLVDGYCKRCDGTWSHND